jgi:transcriptional regulator with XRE-family HTH domain
MAGEIAPNDEARRARLDPSGARNSATVDDVTGGGAEHRTREFGRFLRNRRAQIDPERAGFPLGQRRRSPGLRREEVAVLAGVSPTWYAYLEQGRMIRPSPEVLDSLARVLDLTDDERRYMHLLALGHPPATPGANPGHTTEDIWQLIEVIGNGPHPLYVGNQYADVVAWNDAASQWYTDFGQLPEHRRNMLWWMLTAKQARQRIENWENDARDVVARLRAAYATRPHDPLFHDRIQQLSQASPEFRAWWGEHLVQEQRARERILTDPALGTRRYRIVTMRIADDGFTAAIVHVPLD